MIPWMVVAGLTHYGAGPGRINSCWTPLVRRLTRCAIFRTVWIKFWLILWPEMKPLAANLGVRAGGSLTIVRIHDANNDATIYMTLNGVNVDDVDITDFEIAGTDKQQPWGQGKTGEKTHL